jgi:hypothetical protein
MLLPECMKPCTEVNIGPISDVIGYAGTGRVLFRFWKVNSGEVEEVVGGAQLTADGGGFDDTSHTAAVDKGPAFLMV